MHLQNEGDIWPRKKPLSAFVRIGAHSKNIELITKAYFGGLQPAVQDLKKRLDKLSLSSRTTWSRLSNFMNEYNSSMEITNQLVW